MTWPLSQDYNEAIQDPHNSFSDAELKTGEAASNAMGIPMPRSGNFADVYEMRCPSGSRWAVKCFTREVFGLRERYAEISKYLRLAKLPFMVDFTYLEQGIRVRGQWYPILKMQWVEGFVLNEFVRDNLDKKPVLQALGQIWLRMAKRLRESYIAHCDLQHGNVLFVPGSTSSSLAVKLIDYDGMCVPSLVGTKSGEVGHPAYQHPERLRTGAYDQEVDRFSLLSIATALRCLAIGGRPLWERYDTGDNLLFRQSDLQAPAESPLFQELLTLGDPQAQKLVTELFRASQGPLDAVPLLTDLIPDEKPAGKVTKTVAVSSSAAVAQQVAGAKGPDWDFAGEESGEPVIKKRRASSGMPTWAWGAIGGAAAVVLLSAGVGVGLFMRKTPTDKANTPVAQNKLQIKPVKPTPKPPEEGGGQDPAPNEVPPIPNNAENKPPVPQAVPARQEGMPVRIFCLSPAGDKLAIADEGSNTWRLIDPRTKQLLHQFSGHTGAINALAFSADGRRAATCGAEKMIYLWDLQAGKQIGSTRLFDKPATVLALSPDGNKVAALYGSSNVGLWDFETKRGRRYSHNNRTATSVAFSPDGRYFAFGFDKSDKPQDEVLVLWPLAKLTAGRGYRGRAEAVSCIAVSTDGKYVAVGYAGDVRSIALWETATGRLARQFALSKGPIHQVAFSPDSRLLLASAVNHYHVWPVEPTKGGSQMGGAFGNQDFIAAAFTPDGNGVTFAYHKAGRVSPAQTVRLPGTVVAGNSPPGGTQVVAWDPPIDLAGDCQFKKSADKLTITIPKDKPHDLAVENGNMNGPRLLRDIEGDFTVDVRVSADFHESRIQAAGLFLMVDEQTYLRLERGRFQGNAVRLWELRRDGKAVPPQLITRLSREDGYLRLERRGNQVFAFVSEDGQTWKQQKPFDIDLPRKVKIGVSALSVSGDFAATFDQFQIKQGQGKWVRLQDWSAPMEVASAAKSDWEPPVDPDHDCQFKKVDGKLAITVPAKTHFLNADGSIKNSPRLLREVEGDFTTQVRVGGDFAPAGQGSWIGAGLLVWVDENTFFRLERAGLHPAGGKPWQQANGEGRRDGKPIGRALWNGSFVLSSTEAYLRLERRQEQLLASFSADGQKWTTAKPLDIALPAKVKIGVLAGSSSKNAFAPTFDQFQLTQGQGQMVSIDWPSIGATGAVVVNPPRRPRRLSNRMTVPDAPTLENNTKQMKMTYRDEYKGSMSKRGLASRLYEDSMKQGDTGMRYAMLNESCELAAQDGDLTAALRAASRLATRFDIDPLEVKSRALEKTLPAIPARDKSTYRLLTQKALLFLDRAEIDEDFDRGERLLDLAKTAAAKADMSALLVKMAAKEEKQFKAQREEYDPIKRFADKLATNPDDADANLAVGRFRCFVRGDWDAGLPLLIKGSEKALSELAQKDVADPADAAARAALGDAWADRGDKLKGKEQEACRRRAYHWYQDCLGDLDKKEQAKELARVKARLTKLASQLPELNRPYHNLDTGIAAVSRKSRLLHLPPQHSIATRELYHGPIDIRLSALLTKSYIRITFLNGGELTLQPENRTMKASFYRPDSNDPDSRGSGPNTYFVSLQAGAPNKIRILVESNRWSFWVNDTLVGNQNEPRALSFASSPVRVWSDDGEIELQALVVKRVR